MLRRLIAVSASAMCAAMISVIVVCQQNGSSNADALQLLGGGLPLFLRLPDGSVHCEEVGADATVGELKNAAAVVLSRQTGATVDPQNVKLCLGGKSLEDGGGDTTPLSEAGVCAEAEIGVRQIDIAKILYQFFELTHDEPFDFSKEDFEDGAWTTKLERYEDRSYWILRIYKDCDCGCDCDCDCDCVDCASTGRGILHIQVDDDRSTPRSGDNESDSGRGRSLLITCCCCTISGVVGCSDRSMKRLRYSGKRKLWEVIEDFYREDVIQELTDDFVHNELQDLLQLIDASFPNETVVKVIDTLEGM